MLPKSRASRTVDVQRMGQAMSRPGMDTRCWFCEAIVTDFKLDEEGAFADITILPSQEPETVRVGPFYAGPGFGFYAPLEKDDHVIVGFPDGQPDQGGVIVARMWSKSDAPPQLARDNDTDVCLVVKKDANLRIQVFGSGNVVIGAEDGKVLLGDETGTSPVGRVGDAVDIGKWAVSKFTAGPAIGAVMDVYVVPPGGVLGTPLPVIVPPAPPTVELDAEIKEGSDKVESS